MKKILLTFFLFFITSNIILSQCLLKEISLDQQIENSELIIEGKVIAMNAFWDANHKRIYTKNTIEVYKIFKGKLINQVEVITIGGAIDNKSQDFNPSLQLQKNATGLFFLNESAIKAENEKGNIQKFRPYSGPQGFYKYNTSMNIVANTFNEYVDIEGVFYDKIKAKTKVNYKEIQKREQASKINYSQADKSAIAIAITRIFPSTITAGTKSVLTIEGSGFGGSNGIVRFSDANTSGLYTFYDALDSQIINWSDLKIEVEVPARAGTGFVEVETSGTETLIAPFLLTIPYAQLNTIFNGVSYPRQHIDKDGSGGYIWQMHTDFNDNTPAKESFTRAFDSWRCETGINWTFGEVNNVVSEFANDNVNIIAFDTPTTELDPGVLGGSVSYSTFCPVGLDREYYIEELDIVIDDDGRNFQFGPDPATLGQIDFETLIVHELGHAHQLGHVKDITDFMYWQLQSGDNRTLGTNNIDAANDVQSRSTTSVVCGQNSMTNHACSLSISEDELSANISIFPNPNQGQFYIQKASFINLEYVNIYDVSGRLVSKHDISNTSNIKIINLRNHIASGVYFANIQSDFGVVTKRFVIE
jgi:hypothetical protein